MTYQRGSGADLLTVMIRFVFVVLVVLLGARLAGVFWHSAPTAALPSPDDAIVCQRAEPPAPPYACWNADRTPAVVGDIFIPEAWHQVALAQRDSARAAAHRWQDSTKKYWGVP